MAEGEGFEPLVLNLLLVGSNDSVKASNTGISEAKGL